MIVGDRVLITATVPSFFASLRRTVPDGDGTVVAFAGKDQEWSKVRVGLFKTVWVKTAALEKVSA